jgi:AcrR family transcriptional regulator
MLIMTKGSDTKQMILEAGLEMGSRVGLEAVSIGALAKAVNMSKSGLFAHFQSKENLQNDILHHAGDLFAQSVVIPALRVEAGAARIEALAENWADWTSRLTGGCIFVRASNDMKDRPGMVRDFLLEQQNAWLDVLRRVAKSAVRVGDLGEGIDYDQFAFEFYSLLLGFNLYHTLLENEDIKERQRVAVASLIQRFRNPADLTQASL